MHQSHSTRPHNAKRALYVFISGKMPEILCSQKLLAQAHSWCPPVSPIPGDMFLDTEVQWGLPGTPRKCPKNARKCPEMPLSLESGCSGVMAVWGWNSFVQPNTNNALFSLIFIQFIRCHPFSTISSFTISTTTYIVLASLKKVKVSGELKVFELPENCWVEMVLHPSPRGIDVNKVSCGSRVVAEKCQKQHFSFFAQKYKTLHMRGSCGKCWRLYEILETPHLPDLLEDQ